MGYTDEADGVDFDVLVVGAGISGINAGYRIQTQCPDRTYAIFEARDAIGGTWDLFRYPGIRSDSDLHTFGFPWRPWTSAKTIADGDAIVDYVRECARTYGIDEKIRYRHKLAAADWSSATQTWTVEADVSGERRRFRARFLLLATGYYNYDKPLDAAIPGLDRFQGQIIHPQFWPEKLDYAGKNVVIVGSGATAITLLPNLVDKAEHVTMLQRSPSYIVSLPRVDSSADFMKRWLPLSWAYTLIRLKYLVLPFLFFKFCRAFPAQARKGILDGAKSQLPKDYPLEPDFSPSYNPWEQRLCVCPSGDFYKALSSPKASVVTAHIEQVTEKSITLKDSPQVLHPDIIVTATGLRLQMLGGARLSVDGEPVQLSERHLWKGALIQDVPNAAVVIGYTNASWTLGADATSQLVTRLLNALARRGRASVTPHLDRAGAMKPVAVLNLNSTYIVKAAGELPKAGDRRPWLPRSSYFMDLWEAQFGSISNDLVYR